MNNKRCNIVFYYFMEINDNKKTFYDEQQQKSEIEALKRKGNELRERESGGDEMKTSLGKIY